MALLGEKRPGPTPAFTKDGSAQESGTPRDFGGFASLVKLAAAAAVAVGMWKPAFCAGFQAPRAEQERCHESAVVPPSERHFHSEPRIIRRFGEIATIRQQFHVKWAS